MNYFASVSHRRSTTSRPMDATTGLNHRLWRADVKKGCRSVLVDAKRVSRTHGCVLIRTPLTGHRGTIAPAVNRYHLHSGSVREWLRGLSAPYVGARPAPFPVVPPIIRGLCWASWGQCRKRRALSVSIVPRSIADVNTRLFPFAATIFG